MGQEKDSRAGTKFRGKIRKFERKVIMFGRKLKKKDAWKETKGAKKKLRGKEASWPRREISLEGKKEGSLEGRNKVRKGRLGSLGTGRKDALKETQAWREGSFEERKTRKFGKEAQNEGCSEEISGSRKVTQGEGSLEGRKEDQ